MGVLDFRVIGLIKDTFTSPITHIYESDNQQHDHKVNFIVTVTIKLRLNFNYDLQLFERQK